MFKLLDNKNNCSLFEIYNLFPPEYSSYKIKEIGFSLRTEKRLLNLKIKTVEELLNLTPNQLINIRGFGNGCLKEIEEFCMRLDEVSIDESGNNIKKTIPKAIRNLSSFIFAGLFSLLDKKMKTSAEVETLENFKDAYSVLGKDIVLKIRNKSDEAQILYFYSTSIMKSTDEFTKFSNIINSDKVHEKKILKAYSLINAYTLDEKKRKQLKALFEDEDSKLCDFKLSTANDDYVILKKFLNWCNFDVVEEIKEYVEMFFKDDRTLKVLQMRAKGKTLQVIGNEIGVTRERVRQIENKSITKFSIWNGKHRILSKISALRDDDIVLTPIELDEYFHPYTDIFILMLKACKGGNYYYDKNIDVFIVGDMNMDEQCSSYLESLPNTFKVTKLDEYIRKGVMLGLNEEYLRKMINSEYTHSFDVYHRTRLSLTSIYNEVLNNHYSEGIHIYDPVALEQFKATVISDFGNISLPQNDRAISARLSDIGLLCDRGKYKPKQKKYISTELEETIRKFMLNSNERIFPINSLFDIFQEDLIAFGIDNKYYMQGVLRELMGDEFTFKRDYIIKGNVDINFYSEIINYIKANEYPVDKVDIQNKYPGITDVVISLATSDCEILNLYGKYIHASKVKWTKEEKRYFIDVIEALMSNCILNVRDLYSYIEKDNPYIMKNLGIYNQYSLFSILNFFLDGIYQFDRPYIIMYGKDAEYPEDYLAEKIADSDEVAINRIVEYARRKHLALNRIIDYLNGLNDTHLLKNYQTIAKIDFLGVNEEVAKTIEDMIVKEIRGTVPIRKLMCVNSFPSINVEWDEWLIYSIINKWSTKLEVEMSNSQFRAAYPLVSRIGEMDTMDVKVNLENRNVVQIDDLDNIDELISDIIIEEMDGSEI